MAAIRPGRCGEAGRLVRVNPFFVEVKLAGPGIATGKETKVEQRVKFISITKCRRIVWSGTLVVPRDVLVALFARRERDVAPGPGANGVDVFLAIAHVTGGNVEQSVCFKRRRDHDRRACLPFEIP